MRKVDLLIIGNLLTINKLHVGGGKLQHCPADKLDEYYDLSEAVVIEGDVVVDSFVSKGKFVVVTGAISTKGGSYE